MDYELLDIGDEARLERFGDRIVERPHPTAFGPRADPGAWRSARLVFDRGRGWLGAEPPTPWRFAVDDLTLELRPTATGQVGIFPEQADSWRWLREQAGERTAPEVLHLFAYTGATTLALAAAGARVAHIDSSRPTVAWARRNAELSGLADRPIRWLVDDVEAFVARERRRGRRYDGIVLDPPSYGHGPGGRAWRLDDDLPRLLGSCVALLDRDVGFVLLTAHTPDHGPDRLADDLAAALRLPVTRVEAGELGIDARSGRHLWLGAFARWTGTA